MRIAEIISVKRRTPTSSLRTPGSAIPSRFLRARTGKTHRRRWTSIECYVCTDAASDRQVGEPPSAHPACLGLRAPVRLLTRGALWHRELQAAVDPGIELGWFDPDGAGVPVAELESLAYERGM